MWTGIMGTWFGGRAQQQVADHISELGRWIALRDELHRRLEKEETVLGALNRQRQRSIERTRLLRQELGAHMARKP